MGKGISYCHRCGLRLLVDDGPGAAPDSGRFCAACRPADAAPTPPPAPAERRKTSTTKIRAQGSGVKPRETTRIRKRSGWSIALPAAALAALGVGLAIAAGTPAESHRTTVAAPPPPAAAIELKPAPKAEPVPSLEELLTRIRDVRQNDLMFDRRDEVLRLLADAAGRAGPRLGEIDLLAVEYDRKFEDAAARMADFTRSEAQRMAAKEKFAEAVERLDGYPAAFRVSRSAAALRELRREYASRRGAAVPASASGGAPPPKRAL